MLAAGLWQERQRRFEEFDRSVFNILKLALHYDLTPELFAQVKKDIRLAVTPEARAEMLLYTDKIKITVTGRQWYFRHGWFWRKKTLHKHLTAEIVFEPYKSTLSVWTDPKAPDGIVCFQ
jgi:hypothetical protein